MKLKNMDFYKNSKVTLIYRGKTKTYVDVLGIPSNDDWIDKNVIGIESNDSNGKNWVTMELGDQK